jgi:hypothetical protein
LTKLPSGQKIHYAAVARHVREITVLGRADLAFWRDQLESERLAPTNDAGYAQVTVTMSDLRWMGIRFNELTISVSVEPPPGATEAAYLACAFNSSKLLTMAERSLFHTPYALAELMMDAQLPASFRLSDGEVTVFEARMSDVSGSGAIDAAWDGPIYLPTSAGGSPSLFYARLEGPQETVRFRSDDVLTMRPWAAHPVLATVIASEFAPVEWRIRHNATHKKSRTYSR